MRETQLLDTDLWFWLRIVRRWHHLRADPGPDGPQPAAGGPMRVGDWIPTFTGRKFYPFDPRPEDIYIEDIAHQLSLQVRWTGATETHYSVAQHCVLVSYACHPEDALYGLLHDAAEAYLHDVNRVVKRAPALDGYRTLEDGLLLVILAKFGLTGPMPASVKHADDMLAETERRDLLRRGPDPETDPDPSRCAPWTIMPMPPNKAEWAFLKRFKRLMGDQVSRVEAIAGTDGVAVEGQR